MLGLATSNQLVPYYSTQLLSMLFFCNKEVAPLALPAMIRKNINPKVVSKLVSKQLLNYNGSSNM